jgi:cytochrome b involved in lipid metabolism
MARFHALHARDVATVHNSAMITPLKTLQQRGILLCGAPYVSCTLMPSICSSVDRAKARSKTALEPGYSLMAWMRLCSQGVDLAGGVGAVDMDDDEATWKEWEVAEVSKHISPEDAWMVIHGNVYNITPYLRFHPGGVSTLLEEAGSDGTAASSGWSK